MDDSHADGIRGLTCVPAVTCGLENKIGSLVQGLDADFLIITGDPIDPRTSVEAVYQEGRRIYDTHTNRRRW
jgi:imidazolonepropionase-like amidohydrolase